MQILHKKLQAGYEDNLQQKIEVLKQTVYPKKKNIHLSNNINKFPVRKSLPKLTFKEKQSPQKQKCLSDRKKPQSPEKMKKTTIEFKSVNLKDKDQKVVGWTTQGWYPSSKSAASLRTKKPISFRQAGQIFEFQKKESISEEKSLKQQYRTRDTQTLLRKNSLFLLSFIRTRERKGKLGPHIGQCPLIFDEKPRISQLQQSRRQYQEQKKPEKKKAVPIVIRKQRTPERYQTPLYPQPW